MGSRDKDQTMPHHQPLLSSLVVRLSDNDGGGSGGGRIANEYDTGELRRDPPPYSRSDRYSDYLGYRIRAGSASPVRRRDSVRHYSPNFDRTGGPSRSREFASRRDPGRYRKSSPPYSRGKVGGRIVERDFDGSMSRPGSFRGEGMARNNPNVRPREGDWICPDPLCGNLNFARREHCNNCRRHRYATIVSPRKSYRGPPAPPPPPPRSFAAPPMEQSPASFMNGYRSPPRSWAREGPRELEVAALLPPRQDGRFLDHVRRDQLDYPEDNYSASTMFDRPLSIEWGNGDRVRDSLYNDRKAYERRLPSPPFPSVLSRDRWVRDVRERSRSPPIRGGPPLKDFRQDIYMERGRDDRRVVG